MKKIFIATPAYDGKVHVQYTTSMVDTCKLLEMHGFMPIIRISVGGSLLAADRNRLLEMFWESEADYMLCLDSDLGWDPLAVIRLIRSGKDFTAGVYPSRDGHTFTFRPELEDDGRIVQCPETNLLKMNYIPAGFMLFTRDVLIKLRDKFKDLYYEPKDSRNTSGKGYCLFNTEIWNGEFWGEDYIFCKRLKEAGIDIWVDPTIQFDHAGVKGSLMNVLTDKKENSINTAEFEALKE
jgi:hypothetical protein